MPPSYIFTLTLLQYSIFSILVSLAGTNAQIAPFTKGMYCMNGTEKGVDNNNSKTPVDPLYMLHKDGEGGWWFHASNGCNKVSPPDGEFLEIPAGGSFQVELATDQASTTFGFHKNMSLTDYYNMNISDYVNGAKYDPSNPYNVNQFNGGCITNPNMHTQNESMAAGTAYAIAYVSDISQVTQDNLVVFSVAYNTPWKRIATYYVPDKMPPCPPGGCICAWGWISNGCGDPNPGMYMTGAKCIVKASISNIPLATPKPPVWCEDNSSNCTKGAKQFIG